MKKVFTLLAGVILSIGAFAQQIPNSSFEKWTSPATPDNFATKGSALRVGGFPDAGIESLVTKDSTAGNVAYGRYAVKIKSDSVTTSQGTTKSLRGGVLFLGDIKFSASATPYQYFGIPYKSRPDTISYAYKYTTKSTDTASIIFAFSKFDTMSKTRKYLLQGGISLDTFSTYRRFITSLIGLYDTSFSSKPDTLSLFIYSSSPAKPVAGSTLWIDSVHFRGSINVSTSINEIDHNYAINAYPNPTHDQLNIAIENEEIGSTIQLFDMAGREVYNGKLEKTTTAIDTRDLSNGIYAINIHSVDKITTFKGKVSIAH